MRTRLSFFLLQFLFPSDLESQDNIHLRYGNPGGDGKLLVKEFYVISHDNKNKIPEWVVYHLTKDDLNGNAGRTEDFRPDPELTPGDRAELRDFKYTGYDRGHMAPANDFSRSKLAVSGTFLLSNMSPQKPNLNRKIWKQLEAEVRSLAKEHGGIWVFTGPLFLDKGNNPIKPKKFIGKSKVAVPTHFFKAILCEHSTGFYETFAFVMVNRAAKLSGKPKDYIVSVDQVERLSGLDFFNTLPDSIENKLEETQATNWPIR